MNNVNSIENEIIEKENDVVVLEDENKEVTEVKNIKIKLTDILGYNPDDFSSNRFEKFMCIASITKIDDGKKFIFRTNNLKTTMSSYISKINSKKFGNEVLQRQMRYYFSRGEKLFRLDILCVFLDEKDYRDNGMLYLDKLKEDNIAFYNYNKTYSTDDVKKGIAYSKRYIQLIKNQISFGVKLEPISKVCGTSISFISNITGGYATKNSKSSLMNADGSIGKKNHVIKRFTIPEHNLPKPYNKVSHELQVSNLLKVKPVSNTINQKEIIDNAIQNINKENEIEEQKDVLSKVDKPLKLYQGTAEGVKTINVVKKVVTTIYELADKVDGHSSIPENELHKYNIFTSFDKAVSRAKVEFDEKQNRRLEKEREEFIRMMEENKDNEE